MDITLGSHSGLPSSKANHWTTNFNADCCH